MIRTIALLSVMVSAVPATAQDWVPMTGDDIRAALTDAKIDYPDGWQTFQADGRTLYAVGGESWGRWRVTEDKYCSQWPPSQHWECFDMERGPGRGVRFVSSGGELYEGVFPEEPGEPQE